MNEITVGIIGLVVVLALFLTGIELAFAMALVGVAGFAYLISLPAALNVLAKDIFSVFSSYGFTVVPLFVLMGQIAYNAGIAKGLYNTAYKFIGHIPGGLAMATVGGAAAFGTITGSSSATAATFASIAIPEMDRYKYNKCLSAGVCASSGTLGSLIPPSVTLIVFGMITEQSIGKLFTASIIPGLIVAALFIAVIYISCKINPLWGPVGPAATWGERIRSFSKVIWVLLIFVVMIGGMTIGLFTPTEGGSVGTCAILLLSVLQKSIDFEGFKKSVVESMMMACMTLMLIAGSTIFGHFLTVTKIPMLAADWLAHLPLHPALVMLMILVLYLVGGSFIDDLAFMVLATPILYPAVLKLGYDPLWFGIILHIFVMIGIVIPPVALNVFIVKNLTKMSFNDIYKGVYPFLSAMLAAAVLLFLFPQLALWLPYAFSAH
ncbi:MAG: Sialic acid TRAP transporter permease protein SiaT [Syntrophorhabdus sp. PtaU1.Bin058]|nr:MAG: Sialic acid TRAP transporter permease protein SiaT [Syntrophorhabdus sp. PtaU1.Bin058]